MSVRQGHPLSPTLYGLSFDGPPDHLHYVLWQQAFSSNPQHQSLGFFPAMAGLKLTEISMSPGKNGGSAWQGL